MADEYTPTTEEVRVAYGWSGEGIDFKRVEQEQREAFNRWLAQVRADERKKMRDWLERHAEELIQEAAARIARSES